MPFNPASKVPRLELPWAYPHIQAGEEICDQSSVMAPNQPHKFLINSGQFYCSLKSHTTCCKVRQQNASSILLASGDFSLLDLLQERIGQLQCNKMAPCTLRHCPNILLCVSLKESSARIALHMLIRSHFCMNDIASQCPWLPLALWNS